MFIDLIIVWFITTSPLGPNAVAAMDAGLRNGWLRASCFAFGVATAALIYATATYAGVSAFFSGHPRILAVLSVIGACYLLFLGLKIVRRPPFSLTQETEKESGIELYLRGLKVSLSNPKAALIFFAVLPKYFTLAQNKFEFYSIFAIVSGVALVVYLIYAFGASIFRSVLLASPRAQAAFNFASAGCFVLIAFLIFGSAFQLWKTA